MGNGAVQGMFSGINPTTAQTNIPGYGGSVSTQSGYFSGGNGNIEAPGTAQMTTCANSTPGPNAMANQYCNAVNFLATNPTTRPQITISPNDSMLVNSRTISNNPTAILQANSISTSGTSSQCVPVTTTTPAQYTTKMCSTVQGMATTQCVIGRVVNINDYTNFQCNQSISAYQTQTCNRTLVVTIPSTIPANATYNCTSGSILVGTMCQPASFPATVNYSCSSGSTLNGTQCQPAPSTATLSYSCTTGTLSGTSCVQPSTSASVSYFCNSGDTLSGTTCIPPPTSASVSYSCPNGGTLSGTTCTINNPSIAASQSMEYLGAAFSTGKSWPAPPWYVQSYTYGPIAMSASSCATMGGTTMSSGCTYACGSLTDGTQSTGIGYCWLYGAGAYTCPSGYTLSGSTCYPNLTTTTYAATATYSCPSGDTLSGTSCQAPSYSASATYSCPSGSTLSGTSCLWPSTSATASYSCPSGDTLSGTSCYPPPVGATVSYTCPSGDTLSGTNCQPPDTTASVTYSCGSGMTLSGTTCVPTPMLSWQDGCSTLETLAQ